MICTMTTNIPYLRKERSTMYLAHGLIRDMYYPGDYILHNILVAGVP